MKYISRILALAFAVCAIPCFGANWYVRPDGGTRYSANVLTGQCNGLADAPYPGTGVNQPCAFNDVRYMWQDGTNSTWWHFPAYAWVMQGGDTLTIEGSIADGKTWRIGWPNASSSYDAASGIYWGLGGDSEDSGMPSPPSGTASNHTVIRGGNYANCSDPSAKTQLHGGFGVTSVIFMGTNLRYAPLPQMDPSDYVDLSCLDITDFADSVNTADFALHGITFSNKVNHVTLTNVSAHGLKVSGFAGPTGGSVTMSHIRLVGNGQSGWDADLGDGTTGFGSLDVNDFDISWNGCYEEYPLVDALPYKGCTDESSGGYGDGFGTATVASPAPGWQVHFDNGVVRYNTQDGLDMLHVGGAGSTVTITRTLAYGNMGQQFKVGGSVGTIQNNVIVGNCEALSNAIPGTPIGYNAQLTTFCRAGNTAVVMSTTPGAAAAFQDNTLFSAGYIGVEIEYGTPDFGPTNVFKYSNNVFYGFLNAGHGTNPAPIYSNGGAGGAGGVSAFPAVVTNPGGSWSNNAYIGANWKCPQAAESSALCTDPGLMDETYHAYGFGDVAPASSKSAVVGAGVAVPGIVMDFNGVARPNPPAIGAMEAAVSTANSATGSNASGAAGAGSSTSSAPPATTGTLPAQPASVSHTVTLTISVDGQPVVLSGTAVTH